MLGLLAQAGCVVGADPDEADVILINTCAFIEAARRESYRVIRQAVGRRGDPVRRVVVAGCLPQRERQRLLEQVPGVDAVVGVFARDEIVSVVMGITGVSPVRRCRVPARAAPCLDDRGRLRLTPRHTAYLRLSEGCSSGCSYCTIPSIRGPLRSKPLNEILAEAAELVADGAVELNLIAQDTTAYGQDLGGRNRLNVLLRRLDELPGLRWVRLMYAHPASLDERTIEAMASCRRVVPYIDLPLQHVSDGILARMRRRYGRRRIEQVLASLRRAMPDIAIRTTFIVGFPGEGRGEFAELLDFIRDQRFAHVGAFAYSPEAGTPAGRRGDRVPPATARRRRGRLMAVQQEIAFAANAARVGQELEVLVDGRGPGRCVARHAGQAPEIDGVCYLTRPRPAGSMLKAKVVAAEGYDLILRPMRH